MRTRLLRAAVLMTLAGSLAGCGLFTQPVAAPPAPDQQELAASAVREALDSPAKAPPLTDTMRVRVDVYADDVCSGLERFGAAYQRARAERREGLYSTPHKAKKAMLAYIDAVDLALDNAVAATAAWGVPDVANGEELATKVRSALQTVQRTNYKYRPQIAVLHSTDKNFTHVARTLLMESEAEVSTALLKLDWFDAGGAFKSAFNKSRTCQAL